jgi:hypothetical protein
MRGTGGPDQLEMLDRGPIIPRVAVRQQAAIRELEAAATGQPKQGRIPLGHGRHARVGAGRGPQVARDPLQRRLVDRVGRRRFSQPLAVGRRSHQVGQPGQPRPGARVAAVVVAARDRHEQAERVPADGTRGELPGHERRPHGLTALAGRLPIAGVDERLGGQRRVRRHSRL